jgi:hypothetical protein
VEAAVVIQVEELLAQAAQVVVVTVLMEGREIMEPPIPEAAVVAQLPARGVVEVPV